MYICYLCIHIIYVYTHTHTHIYIYIYIHIYIYIPIYYITLLPASRRSLSTVKGYEEKHSHTAARHPVVKPPAAHSRPCHTRQLSYRVGKTTRNYPGVERCPLSTMNLVFVRSSFTSKLSCTNQSSSHDCPPPPALPTLLHYCCAIYDPPPPRPPFCMPYTRVRVNAR